MPTERDHAHTDAHAQGHGAPIVHAEIRTGPGGSFLLGAGATLLLAATAILLIPMVSPAHTWIVSSLAERGLTSLPLFAAGTLFTGLWLAVRTSREHSIAAQYAAMSAGPAIEHLTTRLVDLQAEMHGVRIEFVYLKDLVQHQVERQNQAANNDTSKEGMYRLAASLDQLGARFEHMITAGQNELREKIEGLWSAIEVARHEEKDGRIHLGDETEHEGAHTEDVEHTPAHSHRPGSGSEDFTSEHEIAASRERLGVLDLLDDLGRLLPKKTTTTVTATPVITADAFEGVQDEGWERHQALAGPLPSLRLDSGPDTPTRVSGLLASPDTHEATDDLSIVRKLEELRALLADSRVRDALTTMDRIED